MTEGIIQKVFKPYSAMNEDIVWLLDRIEQELIEGIEKAFDSCWTLREFKESLIGDIQE